MKAVYLKGPGVVSCVEQAMPSPLPGQALIRVRAAGICGSDLGAFRGTNQLVSYPRVIGHEAAGEIVSIPEENPQGLRPGDRVVLDPYLFCGQCYPCSIGRTNCCTKLRVLGVQTEGAMAEFFCHPVDRLLPIPAGMSWEQAALAEPLTISLHGIHRGRLKAGEWCVIIGAGPIGLAAAMAAEAYGARAVLLDLVEARLAFARSLGVARTVNVGTEDAEETIRRLTDGQMAQLVMECSGAASAVRSSLAYVCHAGRVTLTGWPKEEIPLPTDVITRKEIDVRGARTSAGEFEEALALIGSRRVHMTTLVTHRISLSEVPEALREMDRRPGAYGKVLVRIGEE